MTKLRTYQQEMYSKVNCAWKHYHNIMVQMPTGTGKTHLMAEIVREASHGETGKERAGVLVVAHRKELVKQISRTLTTFGIRHGMIVGGKPIDDSKPVQVASIQSLHRRLGDVMQKFSLVIIDEAHHALAETYRILWEKWPRARFLGMTATPCRMNGAAFTDLFDILLQSWTIQAFIEKGWLSDFEYVSASPDSQILKQIRLLKKRGADGDYQAKEMATVLDVPASIAHLYKTYRQFACGRKGIVYAIDREHARHITEYYGAH